MTIKGDTIQFEVTADENITGWKIRAELYDEENNNIQLATANSGGSDDQIEVTDAANGVFIIKVPSGETTNMEDLANLEIEVDTGNTVGGQSEIITIYQGQISLSDEKITWTSPS